MRALRDAVQRATPHIQALKRAHWAQHGASGDLHELNYLIAVCHELRADGALVYFEVPALSGDRATGRIDALALHEQQGWALALEAKSLLSAGNDLAVAHDVAKLDRLRLRRTVGSLDVARLQCHTALLLSTWRADFATWWNAADHDRAPEFDVKRPEAWGQIAGYLSGCIDVDATDITVKIDHWLLHAVRAVPGRGAFWQP